MLLSGQLGVALYLSTVDYTILLCVHWNGETIKSQASWWRCYVQKYNVYQLIEKEKLSLHNHLKIKTVTFHKHQ